MDLNDLNKVWEVKPLKKVREDEAREILENVAKQVQPIMRKRKWKVRVLSEFCPSNPSLLGLNVGGGAEVKLRLRRPNNEWDFFPYEQILDTMLHELCHNEFGPHNADFYNRLDEIRKVLEKDLIFVGDDWVGSHGSLLFHYCARMPCLLHKVELSAGFCCPLGLNVLVVTAALGIHSAQYKLLLWLQKEDCMMIYGVHPNYPRARDLPKVLEFLCHKRRDLSIPPLSYYPVIKQKVRQQRGSAVLALY